MLNRKIVTTSMSALFDAALFLTGKDAGAFMEADVVSVDGRLVYGNLDDLGLGRVVDAAKRTLHVVDIVNDSGLDDVWARTLVSAYCGITPDDSLGDLVRAVDGVRRAITKSLEERSALAA